MSKYGYYEKKDKIDSRLKRIEGQVRGINGMVQDDKYCIDILTQVSAVQSALNQVALELLAEHTRHCLSNSEIGPKDNQKKIEELVMAVSRMI